MAIDTRNERASTVNILLPFGRLYPNPDASLASEEDRQHMAYLFAQVQAVPAPSGQVSNSNFNKRMWLRRKYNR